MNFLKDDTIFLSIVIQLRVRGLTNHPYDHPFILLSAIQRLKEPTNLGLITSSPHANEVHEERMLTPGLVAHCVLLSFGFWMARF